MANHNIWNYFLSVLNDDDDTRYVVICLYCGAQYTIRTNMIDISTGALRRHIERHGNPPPPPPPPQNQQPPPPQNQQPPNLPPQPESPQSGVTE